MLRALLTEPTMLSFRGRSNPPRGCCYHVMLCKLETCGFQSIPSGGVGRAYSESFTARTLQNFRSSAREERSQMFERLLRKLHSIVYHTYIIIFNNYDINITQTLYQTNPEYNQTEKSSLSVVVEPLGFRDPRAEFKSKQRRQKFLALILLVICDYCCWTIYKTALLINP